MVFALSAQFFSRSPHICCMSPDRPPWTETRTGPVTRDHNPPPRPPATSASGGRRLPAISGAGSDSEINWPFKQNLLVKYVTHHSVTSRSTADQLTGVEVILVAFYSATTSLLTVTRSRCCCAVVVELLLTSDRLTRPSPHGPGSLQVGQEWPREDLSSVRL